MNDGSPQHSGVGVHVLADQPGIDDGDPPHRLSDDAEGCQLIRGPAHG
jgi:hypothetical protein